MEPISLTEHEDWLGELFEEEARFIYLELLRKVSIRREPFGTRYVLNPNQHVGVITLPSGRRLESRPKVPVRNLFYMLAVALDLPFRDELAKFERLDQLLEFVATYFTERLEQQIDQGLHRSYMEEEASLPVVRGRIDFARDLRENSVLRHRTYSRYADFTWDIPENQALRQVAHFLSGWDFGRDIRLRLSRIDSTMAEVTPTFFRASDIERFTYHRLNEEYRPQHQLCRLFLEGASLSEDIGYFDFRTFLVDMNILFEQFVMQVLVGRALGGTRVAKESMHLDYGRRVSMVPDISVWKAGTVRAVADCKYKRIEPDEFRNHDIYQVLAYCIATKVPVGLLIYPRHQVETEDEITVRNAEVAIRSTTVDLSGDISELEKAAASLARKVFELADAVPRPSFSTPV